MRPPRQLFCGAIRERLSGQDHGNPSVVEARSAGSRSTTSRGYFTSIGGRMAWPPPIRCAGWSYGLCGDRARRAGRRRRPEDPQRVVLVVRIPHIPEMSAVLEHHHLSPECLLEVSHRLPRVQYIYRVVHEMYSWMAAESAQNRLHVSP